MAVVAARHRTAARLRQVADEEAVPPDLLRLAGEALEKGDELRMSPIAVARRAHHLPGRAVDRQRYGAGEAALRIKTDGVRSKREGFGLARKQLFRRTRQQIGVGGRPLLLASRTGFLRERRSEHDEKQHQAEP